MLPTGKKGFGSVFDHSWYVVGVVGALAALAGGPAAAQDFSAGKTPAQLFQSDCSACHKSPAGLAKRMDARSLATFLREHYTTKEESAVTLAAYLASVGGGQRSPATSIPGGANPGGPKPKAVRGGEGETGTVPRPRANIPVEPTRQPEADGVPAREESPRRGARTPPAPREDARAEPTRNDGAKVEPEAGIVSKLKSYGSSGGDVKTIERSADQAKKVESYANTGSTGEPANTGTTNAAAAPQVEDASAEPKRRPAEKTKKDAASAASAPAAHSPRSHRPAPIQPPPGSN